MQVLSRMVSVWREATNKLVCTTDRQMSKELGLITCMEPVARLTMAVGVESGRVVLLHLDDWPAEGSVAASSAAASTPRADPRKRIVAVRSLFLSVFFSGHAWIV
jgi:hypothetical protein